VIGAGSVLKSADDETPCADDLLARVWYAKLSWRGAGSCLGLRLPIDPAKGYYSNRASGLSWGVLIQNTMMAAQTIVSQGVVYNVNPYGPFGATKGGGL